MKLVMRIWYPTGVSLAFVGIVLLGASALVSGPSYDDAMTTYALGFIFSGLSMCLFAGIFLLWRLVITGKNVFD